MIRQTHTYVVLDLSPAAYQEIRAKLLAADYGHVFDKDDGREVIDMHGIAVAADAEEEAPPQPVRHSFRIRCWCTDCLMLKSAAIVGLLWLCAEVFRRLHLPH